MAGKGPVSAELAYLVRAWRDEYPAPPGFLEHTYLPEREWTDRIVEERFIRWLPQYKRAADGPGVEPLYRDDGRPVLGHHKPTGLDDPDEWILPVHEAVKRTRGRTGKVPLEHRLLAAALRWTGSCPCSCPGVMAHLAARFGISAAQVSGAVSRAARACVREVHGHDFSAPLPARSPTVLSS